MDTDFEQFQFTSDQISNLFKVGEKSNGPHQKVREKKKKMKATRTSRMKNKKDERVDFTVIFSTQGETKEENIHQIVKIKKARERVNKLIKVDNSEGRPEHMKRNIELIPDQDKKIQQ